jgi:uncharacterized protein (DUF2132 family)
MHLQPHNPLQNKTLEMILQELVDRLGWEEMGMYVNIKCFQIDPSITSSLVFLRRTPWAREKVERLYTKLIAK